MGKTTAEKLKDLKKLTRQVTKEERIECGFAALESAGLDRDQIEDIARDIGLGGESFAFAVATAPFYRGTLRSHDTKQGVRSRVERTERSRPSDVESVVDQVGAAADSVGHSAKDEAINMVVPERLVAAIERLADHFDPPPPDIVDTGYVAERLGCTREYVSQMAKKGSIPSNCIVAGTGWGKVWKFYRSRIDRWIDSR